MTPGYSKLPFSKRIAASSPRHCLALVLLVAGCVQPRFNGLPGRPELLPSAAQPSAAQPETPDELSRDRIARLERLASFQGAARPEIEQAYAPAGSVPGATRPIPVVRIVFDERAFFDFDRDVPRADVQPTLDLIADSMRRDAPGAALTVLGHTDATGTDEYNLGLSRRRAANVLAMLIQHGVDPGQLSAVAIGKAQPIATNATEAGRARNRRVEFMMSGSEPANLAVVADRVVNGALFRTTQAPMPPEPTATNVRVFKPAADLASLTPAGTLSLRTPRPAEPATVRRPIALKPTWRTPTRENPPVSRPAEPLPALREPSEPRSY